MIKRSTLIVAIVFAFSAIANAWQVSGYNLTKGDSYSSSSEVKQVITQTVMGQKSVINQDITTQEKLEVVEVNGSNFTLAATNVSTKLELSSIMFSQTIDSEGGTETDGVFRVLKGKSYQFTINELGEVLEITGLEEIQAAITEELQGSPLAAQAGQITAAYSEETIRANLENQFSIYPKDKAEAWSKKRDVSINGLPVTLDSQYLYEDDSTILVNSELTVSGKISQNGMELDATLEGTQEAKLTLDPKSGICTVYDASQLMDGSVTTQGMQIPMSVETSTKITTSKD